MSVLCTGNLIAILRAAGGAFLALCLINNNNNNAESIFPMNYDAKPQDDTVLWKKGKQRPSPIRLFRWAKNSPS